MLCVAYMNVIKTALGTPSSHYRPSTWIHVYDGDGGRLPRQGLADLFCRGLGRKHWLLLGQLVSDLASQLCSCSSKQPQPTCKQLGWLHQSNLIRGTEI